MVTHRFKKMIAEANAVIETVSVQDALVRAADPGVQFVDLRDAGEREKDGAIPGAVHAPRGFLEFIADPESPMHNPAFAAGKQLLLYCASGGRSTLGAKTLRDMGLANVAHIAGGFQAWREAGGPVDKA